MTALSGGWHELATNEAIAGTQYSFELNEQYARVRILLRATSRGTCMVRAK